MAKVLLIMLKNTILLLLLLCPVCTLWAQENFDNQWVLCEVTNPATVAGAVGDSTCVYTVDTSAVLCIINDPAVEASVQGAKKHPALAAALSALFPGTGQIYASDFKKGWGLLALHCLVRPLVTWMPYMVSFEGIQFISKIIPRFIVGILDGVLVVYAIVNAIDLAKQANGTMTETCSRER